MIEISENLFEVYSENLPQNWWDGSFNVLSAKICRHGRLVEERIEENAYWRKERLPLFVGENEIWGCLECFSQFRNGQYLPYPAFALTEILPEDGQKSISDFKVSLELYFDAKGYSASMVSDGVVSYHPLMLRPFQNQTGYCIGGIQRTTFFGKNLSKYCIITLEHLCDKMRWQDLVRFAKPYSDYFAAAGVSRVISFDFEWMRHVYQTVPLYVGRRCVAVKIQGGIEISDQYISYQEYKEKILRK